MINLVFDGNYLMHKTMYVYQRASRGPMLDTFDDRKNFMKKFMMDFAFAIRKFKKLKKVIITWDDYSWRKDVEIDQNDGYKSNRVKDETKTNWEEFKNLQNQISDIIAKYNLITSRIPNAEGDDTMFFWKEYFLSNGEDVAILSGDRDISQLVEKRGNNFCVVYDSKSTNRILFAPKNFKDFLDNDSMANLLDMSFMVNSLDDVKALLDDAKYIEVDPIDVIWEKIISGDSGDAVPPVWNWTKINEKKKTESNFKVTAAKAKLIKEDIINHLGEFNLEKIERFVPFVVDGIKKYHKQDADPDIVKGRMLRNKILVELSYKTIPKDITENFKIHAKQVKDILHPTISIFSNKTLLEGTDYEIDNSFQSDFFSNANKVDKRTKKLF